MGKQWSRDSRVPIDSPMLSFATKKLSTDANGQKEDAASSSSSSESFSPRARGFDGAVMSLISLQP